VAWYKLTPIFYWPTQVFSQSNEQTMRNINNVKDVTRQLNPGSHRLAPRLQNFDEYSMYEIIVTIMSYFQYNAHSSPSFLTAYCDISVRHPLFSHTDPVLRIRRKAVNYTCQTHTAIQWGHQLPPIYNPNDVMKRRVIIMEYSVQPPPLHSVR
jgi:hypothetical protein